MREKLLRLAARRDLLREQVASGRDAVAELERRHRDALEAQAAVQAVAEAVQRSAHGRVASVVTRCLEAVFGPDAYQFETEFVRRRGKTEAEFRLTRGGDATDPLDGAGGGVCDVAAFALRAAALALTRPRKRQLLVLDEPMKMLSAGYRERVAGLLEELAEELGVQFLVVTHHPEFRVGNVVRL